MHRILIIQYNILFSLKKLIFQLHKNKEKISTQQNNQMATTKHTQHTIVQNTKNSNNNYPKSLFSISDVNKLYRRQQTYKKKLKAIIQTNCLLEARIKIYQSTIGDERSTILFQLNQLSKTMNSKISTYVDEKLDKDKFKDNQQALQTIKQMINKFQTVQKQTKVTKKVYHNLNSIHQRYIHYSQQIDTLVKMTQKSNKQYEDSMKNMLNQKQSQILLKRQNNEDIYDNTQTATKKIDQYQAQKIKLIQQQGQLLLFIQKLKRLQKQTKNEVDRFKQWAEIVIDKNHRKMFNKDNKQKQQQYRAITSTNMKLKAYLNQLENEEQFIQQKLKQKENQIIIDLKKYTSRNKKNKANKSFNHLSIKHNEVKNGKKII